MRSRPNSGNRTSHFMDAMTTEGKRHPIAEGEEYCGIVLLGCDRICIKPREHTEPCVKPKLKLNLGEVECPDCDGEGYGAGTDGRCLQCEGGGRLCGKCREAVPFCECVED